MFYQLLEKIAIQHFFAKIHIACENLARSITLWSGSTFAFIINCLLIMIWLVLGPFYNFSDSYQLIANTSTTIITYLMVFLIQRTQNKDSLALQMKLNELIAAHSGASNKLLNIENLSEEDILKLQRRYKLLAELSKEDIHPLQTHTVEEIP